MCHKTKQNLHHWSPLDFTILLFLYSDTSDIFKTAVLTALECDLWSEDLYLACSSECDDCDNLARNHYEHETSKCFIKTSQAVVFIYICISC